MARATLTPEGCCPNTDGLPRFLYFPAQVSLTGMELGPGLPHPMQMPCAAVCVLAQMTWVMGDPRLDRCTHLWPCSGRKHSPGCPSPPFSQCCAVAVNKAGLAGFLQSPLGGSSKAGEGGRLGGPPWWPRGGRDSFPWVQVTANEGLPEF